MKRLLSVCLVLCFVVSFSACGAKMTPVEEALIAVKALDAEAFSACMTSDSETALSRIVSTVKTDISEEERATLQSLYGLIRYTMGEESEAMNGAKTVKVTVKLPDMARVRTLAEKKILVSAETANAVVSEMLTSGEIEQNYMLETVWEIKMTEEDGKWLIPYTDHANDAFASGLYLLEMLMFFAQH